ncbi:hypothetical protein VHA01S_056_00300 [Vibrio halioticoli NBRC 102217]|uniref:Uncharacterized protein n=1 Tax=Vibrio halioticoli NBRC 102217 TaxID=1219072 RepID=V5FGD6_9VIBR|nr:hypothetical protein [Vibrio halioticoli]GAD90813.1 hypothetical protein VHA01S_056_00300 [Vibrio halioticoli NBRC 102217]
MKFSSKVALMLGVISSAALANEIVAPLDGVEVVITQLPTLSIQNISNETVSINIYGETLKLAPTSGVQYACKGYHDLELQVLNNDHDYFEVPCQSKVVFTELFKNQRKQGE